MSSDAPLRWAWGIPGARRAAYGEVQDARQRSDDLVGRLSGGGRLSVYRGRRSVESVFHVQRSTHQLRSSCKSREDPTLAGLSRVSQAPTEGDRFRPESVIALPRNRCSTSPKYPALWQEPLRAQIPVPFILRSLRAGRSFTHSSFSPLLRGLNAGVIRPAPDWAPAAFSTAAG